MKILDDGANGMVAGVTTEYCLSIGDDVIALPRRDLDISDSVAVDNTVDEIRRDALLNCAAYTNVDGADNPRQLAYDVNATGV